MNAIKRDAVRYSFKMPDRKQRWRLENIPNTLSLRGDKRGMMFN